MKVLFTPVPQTVTVRVIAMLAALGLALGYAGVFTASASDQGHEIAGAQQHVLDFNGDGKTDWTVVRNIGGGANGQVAWFTRYTGLNAGQTDVFGTAADQFISGDFDNDDKSDVAVWRSHPTAAFFYIMRSSDSTFVPVQWGKLGDDPNVVGDYDGDGKTDFAVYRPGATTGQQSFWHILKSSDGGYLPIQWGQNGDFPAPGDYDGDLRSDAAVQRNAGGGSAIFFRRYFNGSFDQIVFGTPSDRVVPGDYDGDGKTDLAITRPIGGVLNWFYDPSSIAGTQIVQVQFGASSTDFSVQGDYDGDGKTDQAVWRGSLTPGQSAFYVNGSLNGFFAFAHGQQGDYPPANFNTH
jgi:spore coat protein A, manganese oxidase